MKHDKAITAGFIIYAIFCLALSIAMIVVAIHFILKLW